MPPARAVPRSTRAREPGGASWGPGGLILSCPMQVHQSTQALRWIMQALQGNGFGSGEDLPPIGKWSPSSPQQHRGSPGPHAGARRLHPRAEQPLTPLC